MILRRPRISEDGQNYYIQIHAEDRERAKRIPGRRWDPISKVWVCPRTPDTYAAIQSEFKHPGDLVEISTPSPASAKSTPVAKRSESGACPVWAEGLTNMPNEIEGLAAQSAAITETVNRILETVERPPTSTEPSNLDESEASATFSFQLRKIALSATKDDPSLSALLDDSFDIEMAPVELVMQMHEHVKICLREFVGTSDQRTRIPDLIDIAEHRKVFVETAPVRIAPTLIHMNRLRNLLAHPNESLTPELRTPIAILYVVNLSLVWPYFASEQMPEEPARNEAAIPASPDTSVPHQQANRAARAGPQTMIAERLGAAMENSVGTSATAAADLNPKPMTRSDSDATGHSAASVEAQSGRGRKVLRVRPESRAGN